jgi:hypothetical protein
VSTAAAPPVSTRVSARASTAGSVRRWCVPVLAALTAGLARAGLGGTAGPARAAVPGNDTVVGATTLRPARPASAEPVSKTPWVKITEKVKPTKVIKGTATNTGDTNTTAGSDTVEIELEKPSK